VDATESKDLAEKYEVKGYPTIKWFSADDKSGVEYSAGRGGEDFVKFINEKVGTERVFGGGFLPTVKRIWVFVA
jgi:protein disulfide-isomerase A6